MNGKSKTENEAKYEFACYFLDLQEEMRRDGAVVNKLDEWERFIANLIEEGDAPVEAVFWKCPRSLTSEIKKHNTGSI